MSGRGVMISRASVSRNSNTPAIIAGIQSGAVNLNDPANTQALIAARAVVGVMPKGLLIIGADLWLPTSSGGTTAPVCPTIAAESPTSVTMQGSPQAIASATTIPKPSSFEDKTKSRSIEVIEWLFFADFWVADACLGAVARPR